MTGPDATPRSPSDAGAEPPAISVVVPVYRAAGTIGPCLAALRAQRAAPCFEVIVVDSSPDDETERAIATEAGVGSRERADFEVRVVRSRERLHPGSARNAGARAARADWLLFVDADCVAAPDLVAAAARAAAGGAVAVGGAIELGGSRAPSARVRHLLEFKESLPGVPARATWTLPSACLLLERATFERHGGFPDTRASEDWLLDWRIWQSGAAMRFDPSLRVAHLTPAGWRALARYLRVLGVASGAVRRRGGLPGQALVRWPALSVGLPFARTARALVWCARYSRRDLAFLLVAWPAYFAMAAVWAGAFYRGVRGDAPLAAKGGRA